MYTQTPCLPLVIGSSQWIVASKAWHVDVVLNDHDVSNFKVLIKTPGCVCQHYRLYSE